MQATTEQIERVKREWAQMAGEALNVEQTGSSLYAYGSELAALRLLAKFRDAKSARYGFSTNLDSWYFSVDLVG